MALTNDQITAQNFKDFYGQIRPYLNGQVPTFANQFSRSDLYSTDEKIIGSFTDGKPIYQKTFRNVENAQCVTTGTSVTKYIDIGASVDVIVDLRALSQRNGRTNNISPAWKYIDFSQSRDNTYSVSAYNNTEVTNTNKISVSNNNTSYNDILLDITIQYTKTTDSAIKVGTGTDYSTDEQIIGTWIDGKPLYQKTFSGTVSSANNIAYVSIGASVDTFVDGRGVMNNSVPLIGVSNDSVSAGVSTFVNSNSAASNKNTFGVYSKPESQSAWIGLSYYFTICYTKTTD